MDGNRGMEWNENNLVRCFKIEEWNGMKISNLVWIF